MDLHTYRALLDQASDHHAHGRYQEALAITDRLLQANPLSADLLVRRARLLQLTPDEGPLEDIDESLDRACTLSPDFTDAHLEMGHYLYAVRDAASKALDYFENAAAQAQRQLRTAMVFQIKCHMELGQQAHAREVLAEARRRFPDDWELNNLDEDEIASMSP